MIMQQRTTSTFAFIAIAAAATLAATLMSGNARAEGPIGDLRIAVGARSVDDVKAEVRMHRAQITSQSGEWTQQQSTELPTASGYTRANARADYLAAREAVRAMNAEDSGSGYLAQMRPRAPLHMASTAAR
jgi:hypothetical protein